MKKTLAAVLSTIVLGAPMAHASVPDVLVAHRGFGGDAQVKYKVPENSIAAWDLAIKQAQHQFYVDLDAQWTSDDKLIVMHDDTIDRTTNRTGKVRSRTLDYIKTSWLELPVDRDGNGNDDNTPYHPPSLNQALDFIRSRSVNGIPVRITLEMKGSYWTQAKTNRLKDVIASKGLMSRVVVHAFSSTYTGYAKVAGFPQIGYVAPSAGPLPSPATVKRTATSIFIRHNLITQSAVDGYNAAGIKVWAWTVDTQAEYDAMAQIDGLYGWVCDDLIEAQQAIQELDPAGVA